MQKTAPSWCSFTGFQAHLRSGTYNHKLSTNIFSLELFPRQSRLVAFHATNPSSFFSFYCVALKLMAAPNRRQPSRSHPAVVHVFLKHGAYIPSSLPRRTILPRCVKASRKPSVTGRFMHLSLLPAWTISMIHSLTCSILPAG